MDSKAQESAMQAPMAYPLAQGGGWDGGSACQGDEWAPTRMRFFGVVTVARTLEHRRPVYDL